MSEPKIVRVAPGESGLPEDSPITFPRSRINGARRGGHMQGRDRCCSLCGRKGHTRTKCPGGAK